MYLIINNLLATDYLIRDIKYGDLLPFALEVQNASHAMWLLKVILITTYGVRINQIQCWILPCKMSN